MCRAWWCVNDECHLEHLVLRPSSLPRRPLPLLSMRCWRTSLLLLLLLHCGLLIRLLIYQSYCCTKVSEVLHKSSGCVLHGGGCSLEDVESFRSPPAQKRSNSCVEASMLPQFGGFTAEFPTNLAGLSLLAPSLLHHRKVFR